MILGGCILGSFLGPVCVVHTGESVDKELGALERLRKGKETPFAEVEDRGKLALKEHPSGEDQGRVYYQLAETYAQSGISVKERAEKVVEYAQKGLQCPLDPVRRLQLHEYWGDGLRFADPTQSFPERRKAAAIAYLKGLKESQKYDIPAKPPGPAPGGFIVHREAGPPPPGFEALERKAAEIAATQKRIRYEEELYYIHKVLIDQLVDVYRREPYAATELREMATEIVGDPATVATLMSRIEALGALHDEPTAKEVLWPPSEDTSEPRRRILLGLAPLLLAAGVVVFALWRKRRRRAWRAACPDAGGPSSGQSPTPPP
jgi:hypothetical protein